MNFLIYSVSTGRRRAVIVGSPTNPVLTDGLGVLKVSDEHYQELGKKFTGTNDPLQDYITQQTGLVPVDDRYAVVDGNGKIVGALIADPLCGDCIPGHTLIRHDKADPSWTYAKDVQGKDSFTAPPAVAVAKAGR